MDLRKSGVLKLAVNRVIDKVIFPNALAPTCLFYKSFPLFFTKRHYLAFAKQFLIFGLQTLPRFVDAILAHRIALLPLIGHKF